MKELATALMQAVEMEARLTDTPIQDELIDQLTLWGAGIFRLVVMGEIKKGKSSFINAMLGEEDLVPVSSDVATSTIYKIRYGREKGYKVHFTPDSDKQPVDIAAAELATFGTEDGNPGNIRQVKFIEVIHPSPILKSGIVIIDTPGLGGLFKNHKLITYEYVPRADAVFFVTDSVESPVGALELEYIKDIRSITPHLYFVQTKCSAVDKEARLARKANNLSILSEALKCPCEKIPYFLLDSRARFRADRKQDTEKLNHSGYPQLMRFISQTLQGNQHKLLTARALVQTRPILEHISELITSRLEVLQAQTEEEKKQLITKLQEAQDALKTWQEEEQPRLSDNLRDSLRTLNRQAMEACSKCRPGGEIQMEFERAIHQCKDIPSLQECLGKIEQQLPVYTAEVAQQTSQSLQNKAHMMLSELAQQNFCTDLNTFDSDAKTQVLNTDALRRVKEDEIFNDTVDKWKAGAMGGMTGLNAAGLVGGIIFSIVPGVGTLIGAVLGSWIVAGFSGYKTLQMKKAQELKSAKQQACNALSQAMTSVHLHLRTTVEQILADIDSRATTAIRETVRQRRNELTKQLEILRDRGKADAKAIEERKATLLKERAQFAAILKVVKSRQESTTEAA